MLGAYIAESIIQSATFNVELVQVLHDRLLAPERMVDDKLAAVKQRGYFDMRKRPSRFIGSNLRTAIVVLESMLEPET
jgi:hypothetical protein